MIRSLFLSLGQLGDPRVAAVFLKSLALTVLILFGLGTGLWFGAESLAARYVDETGTTLAGAVAVLAALALGWLLFRTVAIAVMDIFADEIVVAVERKHYPAALDTARGIPLMRSLTMGLGAAGRAILVNLLLAPLYIVLIVTGIGTPIAFILVNGWLLGRDLGDMVAARHMPREAMRGWRATTRVPRFVLGVAVAGLFVVPILNLLAPVLGAAMATHLFHAKGRS
ncbi:EI24 domain-containing protein [Sphingomonas sp. AR_OL41]|uniref:EI24 domain-containing protein n=1 Tax=Sphingomonas sp. AR_OL41 TaxID=3042729 RepID=UPI0024818C4E|nr:EI24 domain-containing protein [Sphingomonas sp. AR_OL41]MDH7971444.1 EI24 domain-containing protein [Sphingomonas sp. AR_OL41]